MHMYLISISDHVFVCAKINHAAKDQQQQEQEYSDEDNQNVMRSPKTRSLPKLSYCE